MFLLTFPSPARTISQSGRSSAGMFSLGVGTVHCCLRWMRWIADCGAGAAMTALAPSRKAQMVWRRVMLAMT